MVCYLQHSHTYGPILIQLPSYKNFRGTIEELTTNQYMNSGEVAIIDSTTIEISELPVKTWTQVSASSAGKTLEHDKCLLNLQRIVLASLRHTKRMFWK